MKQAPDSEKSPAVNFTWDTLQRLGAPLDGSIAEMEVYHLRYMLDLTGGNQAEAARRLGINPRTIRYYIRKHGLR